jgi:hypothetical protein
VIVPAWDPKDCFIEHVTVMIAQSTELICVGLVEYHSVFPVLQMSEA